MIMIKCQHCGKQIPYDANLCPYCGRSIKQFQQKEVLDDEQESDSIQESSESLTEKPLAPQPDSDKKWLFYIIALLAMLLIVGAVYHSSI